MSVLSADKLKERLSRTDDSRLVVTPLLDPDHQIGPCSIDIRLGTRFTADLRTRQPFLDLVGSRPVDTFFDTTYRDFGEGFILYPGQFVLGVSLEYFRIPHDVLGHVVSRSSINRLGVMFSTLVQPGYTGTLTLELTNHSSNPIQLLPGMRIAQMTLQLVDGPSKGYIELPSSKYIGNIGPRLSGASQDPELPHLGQLSYRHAVTFGQP